MPFFWPISTLVQSLSFLSLVHSCFLAFVGETHKTINVDIVVPIEVGLTKDLPLVGLTKRPGQTLWTHGHFITVQKEV